MLLKRLVIPIIGAASFVLGTDSASPEVVNFNLNCRTSPTTYAHVVERLSGGQKVAVLAVRQDWARIQKDNHTRCWVVSRGLTRGRGQSAAREHLRPSIQDSAPKQLSQTAAKPAPEKQQKKSATLEQKRRAQNALGCPCEGPRKCIGPSGNRYCLSAGALKDPPLR